MNKLARLFEPLKLGELTLANRIVMAPMTRNRATPDGVPTDAMVAYYGQRASAGLIVAEGDEFDVFDPGFADRAGDDAGPAGEAGQQAGGLVQRLLETAQDVELRHPPLRQ